MKFEYPYASPTVEVILRDPALGDSLQHNTQVRFAKSMDDTLYTYKYTGSTRRWLWNFESITKSLKDSFLDFVKQSAGREIKVTMYDSTVLRGRMTSINPMESTSRRSISEGTASSDPCIETYDITVEFEGEVA
jgi:hypothetical protein